MAKRIKGLVIVESPAKAKKINTYLGSQYVVKASMGHVRDLPERAAEIPAEVKKLPWAKDGVNVDDDFKPLYVVAPEKKKVVTELKTILKDADELILATDEDREGESIGWHLQEILKPKVPVKRMVFSEITKEAIQNAIKNPRDLDMHLVNAQEARRVLDRLYGYRLSPLLWKKIKPKISAGRVQSVAVRLIVQKERERRAFRSGRYWDIKAKVDAQGQAFEADLVTLGGTKIATGKDFDEHTGRLKEGTTALLLDEAAARGLIERVKDLPWTVAKIEEREEKRRPSPPFTTSTLQQDSSRKLSLSARDTMRVAQRLYEEGYITYMRTDSVTLSQEAIGAVVANVKQRYGQEYLHTETRQFSNKSKNAQEAHEAIRPAGTEMKTGEELGLSGNELRLYNMIWMRTMATQMAEARMRYQTVTLAAADAEFRATGHKTEFAGFRRAYVEGFDDPQAAIEDQDSILPVLTQGAQVDCKDLQPLPHETQPPARYTEASLIKALEEDGVGRPSTYASIISTILDREYVTKNGTQLRPTYLGMAVTQLLEQHFPNLVNEQFTARMEEQLDEIAGGQMQRTPYLRQFYSGQEGLAEQVKLHETQIDPRLACTLELDGVEARIRIGRYGPYVEKEIDGETVTCSLPDDVAPADLTNEIVDKLLHQKKQGPKTLGPHPETGQSIYVMRGPFGPYLQLGEQGEDGKKPKRVGIPKNVDPDTIPHDLAVKYLGLPRHLGAHPETGKVVNAGIGRFGPFVLHAGVYKSLGKDDDVLTISLEQAVELLKTARGRGGATPLKDFGPHPEDQQPVQVFSGRYGNYVKHGKTNATIPKDRTVESLELQDAIELLKEREARGDIKPRRGRKSAAPARKAPARKAAAARKTVAPKTGAKAVKKKTTSRKRPPEA